ncbi:MAG: ABC transporter ATP-binding protein [Clostridia bacterium]|nr:ABC transporter ATP-binding protein [Clostridia bacterium]
MSSLIEIKNVYKIYNPGENEVRALDGVSLKIENGEFVAIIGQSGSGKSTLMNMIGMLDKCTSGEYYMDGIDVLNMTDNQMSEIRNKKIGFIFQGFNLISSLTAKGNVELPLIYRGMKKQERENLSQQALEMVGLKNRINHRPSQMSGGQQQRVAIARAIAAKPPIILADEPTGNLDSKSGVEVMKIIHQLHSEGRTIILITHDNLIAQEAERIIRIHDGKIVEDYYNKAK